MGYSFRLAARVLLYASSHRQDNTYHGFCYTSRGALAGTRNRSIRWPIAPWANALTMELPMKANYNIMTIRLESTKQHVVGSKVKMHPTFNTVFYKMLKTIGDILCERTCDKMLLYAAKTFYDIPDVYVNWNVPYISYNPKCYYGRLWDFIWSYAPIKNYTILASTKPYRTLEIKWSILKYIHIHISWIILYFVLNYHWSMCLRRTKMFYLTTNATHFIYGYMASDIWRERKPAAATWTILSY